MEANMVGEDGQPLKQQEELQLLLLTDQDEEKHRQRHSQEQQKQGRNWKKDGKAKYRECLKNHAASMGGHANDGCGEFMASGEKGSLEALSCAACGCHRNFHRREAICQMTGDAGLGWKMTGEPGFNRFPPSGMELYSMAAAAAFGRPYDILAAPPPPPLRRHSAAAAPPPPPPPLDLSPKKRFRTKFTSAQKDDMGAFAEQIGWRIQKQDEAAVQRFCAHVGVKRHVLKVWMHNNKSSYASKKPAPPPPPPPASCLSESDELKDEDDDDDDDEDDDDDDDDEASRRS